MVMMVQLAVKPDLWIHPPKRFAVNELPQHNAAVSDEVLAKSLDIDALYRKYARRSLAFLASLGVNDADAEDVHQAAWMKAIKALRAKPFEGNFRAWLFQIMRNAVIDRSRKRTPSSLEGSEDDSALAIETPPDTQLIESEYQQRLKRCLDRLPDDQRTLIGRRLAGDDYGTIADSLQVTVTRAHRVFHTAKEAMTGCLKSSEEKS